MELSRRLKAITDLLSKGDVVADVGCDHGYVSIYLTSHGIFKRALAMDVRSGPLDIAKKNIEASGLEDCIETRLSDGLKNYTVSEADAMVVAGMGGILMKTILSDSIDKVLGLKQMVLQPQSEIEAVRGYVRELGLFIDAEDIIHEDGKFYPMFHVVHDKPADDVRNKVKTGLVALVATMDVKSDLSSDMLADMVIDRYGEYLLYHKHDTLKNFLHWQRGVLQGISKKLLEAEKNDGARLKQKLIMRMNQLSEDMLLSAIAIGYVED